MTYKLTRYVGAQLGGGQLGGEVQVLARLCAAAGAQSGCAMPVADGLAASWARDGGQDPARPPPPA